ncbi:ATP-binding protein [Candidatus Bipolaricaulota bacterium]|nr:ATP-binding protein [Candidatus Bipolaricaulota bacterium]
MAELQERWRSGQPELFVVYGRRRVGKIKLLLQFFRMDNKKTLYFLASQVTRQEHLCQFTEIMRETFSDPVLQSLTFTDWEAVLTYLGERAREERLLLILDEFPYLCEAAPGLPSAIRRFWDLHGKETKIFLVLCGSQLGFMEREVLGERSPLYGRRTRSFACALSTSVKRVFSFPAIVSGKGLSPAASSAACPHISSASHPSSLCARTSSGKCSRFRDTCMKSPAFSCGWSYEIQRSMPVFWGPSLPGVLSSMRSPSGLDFRCRPLRSTSGCCRSLNPWNGKYPSPLELLSVASVVATACGTITSTSGSVSYSQTPA